MPVRRSIIILGGGISGLTALHVLRRRFQHRSDVAVTLLENNESCGGCIQTSRLGEGWLEHGPTGFQKNSSAKLLGLIEELGLAHRLVSADDQARIRLIKWNNRLHPFAQSPASFMRFPVLTLREKLRFLMEWFTPIPHGAPDHETVASFGYRHFGRGFTDKVMDAIVTGIYAGDMHRLVMSSVFPRMVEWERREGSLLKAIFKHRKTMLPRLREATLLSFEDGMAVLPRTLCARHADHIITRSRVCAVVPADGGGFVVATKNRNHHADAVVCALPCHAAARVFETWRPHAAAQLATVNHASVTVVGLAFDRSQADEWLPKAFGYLVPRGQRNNGVLGVLFHTRIFPSHGRGHHIVRVMFGGTVNESSCRASDEVLIEQARQELQTVLKNIGPVRQAHVIRQMKSIPQYDRHHAHLKTWLRSWLGPDDPIFIGSAVDGVSVGQCVASAWNVLDKFSDW